MIHDCIYWQFAEHYRHPLQTVRPLSLSGGGELCWRCGPDTTQRGEGRSYSRAHKKPVPEDDDIPARDAHAEKPYNKYKAAEQLQEKLQRETETQSGGHVMIELMNK